MFMYHMQVSHGLSQNFNWHYLAKTLPSNMSPFVLKGEIELDYVVQSLSINTFQMFKRSYLKNVV